MHVFITINRTVNTQQYFRSYIKHVDVCDYYIQISTLQHTKKKFTEGWLDNSYLDLRDLWSQHFAGDVKGILIHIFLNQVDVSSLQLQIGTKFTVSLHQPLLN